MRPSARATADRLERWLSAPAPAERLALFRILVGLYALVYLVVRLPVLVATTRLSAGFEPVGILWFLDAPPGRPLMLGLIAATVVTAVGFTTGIGFRLTGPAFALGLLVLTTWRSSWGQLLWFDNLLVLHVLIVAVTRAGDALVPRPRRPTGTDRRPGDERRPATAPPPALHRGVVSPVDAPPPGLDRSGGGVGPVDVPYGWPLRLCALVTVASYVLAGVAKVRIGGPDWLDGSSLGHHVAWSAARLEVLGGTPSPLARVVVGQLWLFTPLAVATLILELGAPALLWRRLRTPWVLGLWSLHAGIAATMFVVFPYPLTLVAFAPCYHLEALAHRLRRSGRGPVGPGNRVL